MGIFAIASIVNLALHDLAQVGKLHPHQDFYRIIIVHEALKWVNPAKQSRCFSLKAAAINDLCGLVADARQYVFLF